VDEVLRNPRRLLEDERQEQSISHPFKAGRDFARQISKVGDRIGLPENHPLRQMHPNLTSLPARIEVARRTDFLDTAENRFVKMVLVDFRDFLAEVAAMLARDPADAVKPNNVRMLRDVARLRGRLDAMLGLGFLPDVSRPDLLPLGSPVLQRKAGYRELLHLWLQFHVGAQLAWDGGSEVWHGGARNGRLSTRQSPIPYKKVQYSTERWICPSGIRWITTDGRFPRLSIMWSWLGVIRPSSLSGPCRQVTRT
jgi:hypothetical protein